MKARSRAADRRKRNDQAYIGAAGLPSISAKSAPSNRMLPRLEWRCVGNTHRAHHAGNPVMNSLLFLRGVVLSIAAGRRAAFERERTGAANEATLYRSLRSGSRLPSCARRTAR